MKNKRLVKNIGHVYVLLSVISFISVMIAVRETLPLLAYGVSALMFVCWGIMFVLTVNQRKEIRKGLFFDLILSIIPIVCCLYTYIDMEGFDNTHDYDAENNSSFIIFEFYFLVGWSVLCIKMLQYSLFPKKVSNFSDTVIVAKNNKGKLVSILPQTTVKNVKFILIEEKLYRINFIDSQFWYLDKELRLDSISLFDSYKEPIDNIYDYFKDDRMNHIQ